MSVRKCIHTLVNDPATLMPESEIDSLVRVLEAGTLVESNTSPDLGSPLPPLILRELSIRCLRSLYSVDSFPIHPSLTVLTGANGGGKSAAIMAIGFLLGNNAFDLHDYSQWADESDCIEVIGVFAPTNDSGLQNAIRVRARQERGASARREIIDHVHRELGRHPDELTVTELRETIDRLGIPVPGRPNRMAKAGLVAAVEAWIGGRPADEFSENWRPLTTEEQKRLPGFTLFASTAAPSPEDTLRTVIHSRARQLLAESHYSEQLNNIGEDIHAEIEPHLEHIKASIKEHCHDIEDIEIVTDFDFTRPSVNVSLRLGRNSSSVLLHKDGDGRRRRVVLAIHEANATAGPSENAASSEIIAYDEPDTHLDYAGQRELFDILARRAESPNTQIVIATHSLNFIDRVPLESVVHFKLDEDRKSRIATLTSDNYRDEQQYLATICAGLGLRNSILLDERCFLVVEGETEQWAIPDMFRLITGRSLIAAGITVVNTKGNGSIRNVVKVIANEWHRYVVVLTDSDTPADWLNDLDIEEGEGLFFVGDDEFEDAFRDDIWVQTLERDFPVADGSGPWTSEFIGRLRQGKVKFSENLLKEVQRRHRAPVSKPDLGLALARTCQSAEDIPMVLHDCFQFAFDVASGNRGRLPQNGTPRSEAVASLREIED